MKKRALITGITGQDGSYLAEYLVGLGYEVWGLMRRTSLDPMLRLESLVRKRRINIIYGNMHHASSLKAALEMSRPHEIYNLAAQSDVGISFFVPEETEDINYAGLKRLVDEAVRINPKVRIYQASTSEMDGKTLPPQNERSSFKPVSPYGKAKLRAHKTIVEAYRKRRGLYICSGILFNHESPRRGEHFVTRKIAISLAKIKLGLQKSFSLGNLNARRDWGYAGDYVRVMYAILQQEKPDDFVIATGESHTVREFVEAVARSLRMKIRWKGTGLREIAVDERGRTILRVDKKYYRPVEVNHLRGDSMKARRELGWKPTVSFDRLAAMMAQAELKRFRHMKSAV